MLLDCSSIKLSNSKWIKGEKVLSKIKDFFIRFDEKCIRMSDLKFTFCIFGLKMALFLITIPLELMLIGTEGIENYPVEPYFGY